MAKRPYEDTRLAKYLGHRILELKPRKTQSEIASEAGFQNANMVTMLKQGANKLRLIVFPPWHRHLTAIRHGCCDLLLSRPRATLRHAPSSKSWVRL
jgi:hypothetical protein